MTFECNQCKNFFYRKGSFEDAHLFCALHDCDKCPFKGKTQGDLQRHILWTWRSQCRLCDYRLTQKSAMTKHIELVYGQLTKYKEPSFSICIECGFTSYPVEWSSDSSRNARYMLNATNNFVKNTKKRAYLLIVLYRIKYFSHNIFFLYFWFTFT